MIDQRLDVDRVWPVVLERKSALERLQELLPQEEDTEAVWRELIGPLYDRLRIVQQWPGGKCRTCGATHPMALRPTQPKSATAHKMWCSKYTGPLEHTVIRSDSVPLTGEPRSHCSCGQSYLYWKDEDAKVRAMCPERTEAWRGSQRMR